VAKTSAELPVGPLRDLLAWWRKTKTKGLIVGGLAVALLGRRRTTQDVDKIVFVEEDRWPAFLKNGERFSFQSRIPDPLAFARKNRVFLVHHENSGIDVDLSLGALPFERQALERVQKVKIGRISAPIATPEDLIILKAIANRPKDRIDIEGLLERCAELDYAYIRKPVDEFARFLEIPGIFQDLDRMLLKHEKERRRRNE
jgi:hypothetical protein